MIGGFFNPILQGGTAASMDVDFVASTQSTDGGVGITFSNLSDPTPVFNFWDFGDGSFSTASTPNKIYFLQGTYSVTLNAVDLVSGGIETKINYINILTSLTYTNATGGTTLEYTSGGKKYRTHTFTSSGSFVVSEVGSDPTIDFIIVAGGGGGGRDIGGGGGAGGYLSSYIISGSQSSPLSKVNVSAQTYTITIGGGGVGSVGTADGTNGSNTTAFGLTASGGGRGGTLRQGFIDPQAAQSAGKDGGSGGGERLNGTRPGFGTIDQGTDGGESLISGSDYFLGGGGGGASTKGVDATTSKAGSGGAGITTDLRNSINETLAGGGGGGWLDFLSQGSASTRGDGGVGGGGSGGVSQNTSVVFSAEAGVINTGGGGGAGGWVNASIQNGENGGSGIVIIRYEIKL